jgi:hypothetical protein
MNQPEIDDLKKLLKDSLSSAGSLELQRDLWPTMLRRLDWTLLAAVTALLIFFPGMIPALLYHL